MIKEQEAEQSTLIIECIHPRHIDRTKVELWIHETATQLGVGGDDSLQDCIDAIVERGSLRASCIASMLSLILTDLDGNVPL